MPQHEHALEDSRGDSKLPELRLRDISSTSQVCTQLLDNINQIMENKSCVKQQNDQGSRGGVPNFRGVTKHRRTQRWESNLWECGGQRYLGGHSSEDNAAKWRMAGLPGLNPVLAALYAQAHDIMAIKCRGRDAILNFELSTYKPVLPLLPRVNKDVVNELLRMYATSAFKGTALTLEGYSPPPSPVTRWLKPAPRKAAPTTSPPRTASASPEKEMPSHSGIMYTSDGGVKHTFDGIELSLSLLSGPRARSMRSRGSGAAADTNTKYITGTTNNKPAAGTTNVKPTAGETGVNVKPAADETGINVKPAAGLAVGNPKSTSGTACGSPAAPLHSHAVERQPGQSKKTVQRLGGVKKEDIAADQPGRQAAASKLQGLPNGKDGRPAVEVKPQPRLASKVAPLSKAKPARQRTAATGRSAPASSGRSSQDTERTDTDNELRVAHKRRRGTVRPVSASQDTDRTETDDEPHVPHKRRRATVRDPSKQNAAAPAAAKGVAVKKEHHANGTLDKPMSEVFNPYAGTEVKGAGINDGLSMQLGTCMGAATATEQPQHHINSSAQNQPVASHAQASHNGSMFATWLTSIGYQTPNMPMLDASNFTGPCGHTVGGPAVNGLMTASTTNDGANKQPFRHDAGSTAAIVEAGAAAGVVTGAPSNGKAAKGLQRHNAKAPALLMPRLSCMAPSAGGISATAADADADAERSKGVVKRRASKNAAPGLLQSAQAGADAAVQELQRMAVQTLKSFDTNNGDGQLTGVRTHATGVRNNQQVFQLPAHFLLTGGPSLAGMVQQLPGLPTAMNVLQPAGSTGPQAAAFPQQALTTYKGTLIPQFHSAGPHVSSTTSLTHVEAGEAANTTMVLGGTVLVSAGIPAAEVNSGKRGQADTMRARGRSRKPASKRARGRSPTADDSIPQPALTQPSAMDSQSGALATISAMYAQPAMSVYNLNSAPTFPGPIPGPILGPIPGTRPQPYLLPAEPCQDFTTAADILMPAPAVSLPTLQPTQLGLQSILGPGASTLLSDLIRNALSGIAPLPLVDVGGQGPTDPRKRPLVGSAVSHTTDVAVPAVGQLYAGIGSTGQYRSHAAGQEDTLLARHAEAHQHSDAAELKLPEGGTGQCMSGLQSPAADRVAIITETSLLQSVGCKESQLLQFQQAVPAANGATVQAHTEGSGAVDAMLAAASGAVQHNADQTAPLVYKCTAVDMASDTAGAAGAPATAARLPTVPSDALGAFKKETPLVVTPAAGSAMIAVSAKVLDLNQPCAPAASSRHPAAAAAATSTAAAAGAAAQPPVSATNKARAPVKSSKGTPAASHAARSSVLSDASNTPAIQSSGDVSAPKPSKSAANWLDTKSAAANQSGRTVPVQSVTAAQHAMAAQYIASRHNITAGRPTAGVVTAGQHITAQHHAIVQQNFTAGQKETAAAAQNVIAGQDVAAGQHALAGQDPIAERHMTVGQQDAIQQPVLTSPSGVTSIDIAVSGHADWMLGSPAWMAASATSPKPFLLSPYAFPGAPQNQQQNQQQLNRSQFTNNNIRQHESRLLCLEGENSPPAAPMGFMVSTTPRKSLTPVSKRCYVTQAKQGSTAGSARTAHTPRTACTARAAAYRYIQARADLCAAPQPVRAGERPQAPCALTQMEGPIACPLAKNAPACVENGSSQAVPQTCQPPTLEGKDVKPSADDGIAQPEPAINTYTVNAGVVTGSLDIAADPAAEDMRSASNIGKLQQHVGTASREMDHQEADDGLLGHILRSPETPVHVASSSAGQVMDVNLTTPCVAIRHVPKQAVYDSTPVKGDEGGDNDVVLYGRQAGSSVTAKRVRNDEDFDVPKGLVVTVALAADVHQRLDELTAAAAAAATATATVTATATATATADPNCLADASCIPTAGMHSQAFSPLCPVTSAGLKPDSCAAPSSLMPSPVPSPVSALGTMAASDTPPVPTSLVLLASPSIVPDGCKKPVQQAALAAPVFGQASNMASPSWRVDATPVAAVPGVNIFNSASKTAGFERAVKGVDTAMKATSAPNHADVAAFEPATAACVHSGAILEAALSCKAVNLKASDCATAAAREGDAIVVVPPTSARAGITACGAAGDGIAGSDTAGVDALGSDSQHTNAVITSSIKQAEATTAAPFSGPTPGYLKAALTTRRNSIHGGTFAATPFYNTNQPAAAAHMQQAAAHNMQLLHPTPPTGGCDMGAPGPATVLAAPTIPTFTTTDRYTQKPTTTVMDSVVTDRLLPLSSFDAATANGPIRRFVCTGKRLMVTPAGGHTGTAKQIRTLRRSLFSDCNEDQ